MADNLFLLYALAVIGGYLLGSISFGLILTRLAGMGDIRAIGSGNIGATNVLRTGNKALAVATLLLDGSKAAAAVLLARWLTGEHDVAIVAGALALIGHIYPVWLRFRGGKGVATFVGLSLAISWPAGLLFCATWLAVAAIFRFSSLAALVATAFTPLYMWLFDAPVAVIATLILAVIVWFAHRANIKRLIAGNEPKIGAKKEVAEEPAGDRP
jgi:glycerol-3-phosphate acyltransferase PlsY